MSSGAVPGVKGDMHTAEYLIENKATTAESLSVKRAWLRKIANEAAMEGKRPALSLQFVGADGKPKISGAWVLMREEDFKDLLA